MFALVLLLGSDSGLRNGGCFPVNGVFPECHCLVKFPRCFTLLGGIKYFTEKQKGLNSCLALKIPVCWMKLLVHWLLIFQCS